jgi:hypothetical protein
MDMIGQRLFTGRVAVAQAALAFATRYASDQHRRTLVPNADLQIFAFLDVVEKQGFRFCLRLKHSLSFPPPRGF